MPAFANILVPFDGSDAAKRALETAVDIASDKAVVTLLQAADSPDAADPTVTSAERMAGVIRSKEEISEIISGYWDKKNELLGNVASEAAASTDKDVEIRSVVTEGSPASIIVGYTKEHEVDIIVMGRRGLGSVRAMLGSVSQRVAHETDLPLLLVK